MSAWAKIGVFIAFLGFTGLFNSLARKLKIRTQRHPQRRAAFFANELALSLEVAGLVLSIWLLTAFFSLALSVALLAAAHIGVVLTAVSSAFLGQPELPWKRRVSWAWTEITRRHLGLTAGCVGLSCLAVLGYALVVGIVYFSHRIPSAEATVAIIRVILAGMFLSYCAVAPWYVVGLLLSENLDEDTRSRFFVSGLGAMGANALYLSLIVWGLSKARGGYQIAVGALRLTISPVVLLTLLAIFAFVHLVPYLAGRRRAAKRRSELLQRQEEWLDRVAGIIEGRAPELYVVKLRDFQAELDAEAQRFLTSEPVLAKFMRPDGADGAEPQNKADRLPPDLIEEYRVSKGLDPRVRYLEFLARLRGETEEIVAQLGALAAEARVLGEAHGYAQAYRSRAGRLDSVIRTERPSKPLVGVTIASVLTVIALQAISEAARWLWSLVVPMSGL